MTGHVCTFDFSDVRDGMDECVDCGEPLVRPSSAFKDLLTDNVAEAIAGLPD